jgi:phospholipid/cholesterol/gamma-HCH transport system substrate-binding protein
MKLSKEFKIGAIAIVVLAATVWGYNFLKGKNIVRPTDEYYVKFDRIDGLIESGSVLHKGYKVGNINSIYFDHKHSGKFILKIVLEERLKIPRQSTVNIKSSSLIASASDLELVFSDQRTYYTPGDTLNSKTGQGIADMLEPLQQKFESVLTGIDSLLVSVNEVLNEQSQQDLQVLISDLSAAVKSLKSSLDPGGDLNNSLASLKLVTGNLAEKEDVINSSLENLQKITTSIDSADLYSTLSTLNQSLASLNGILTKIDEGGGTIGLLVNDSSLYTNLDSAAYHLDKLMKDLQEHPKRYVHLSVFGRKDK